jgi:hypothetical protein
MKLAACVGVITTALLSACASTPKSDYSILDAECVRTCKSNEAECKSRYADYPTILFAHCQPELKTCLKECPPPGTHPITAVVNPASGITNSATKPTIAERLKLLEELHKNGVITDKEYTDKRQDILNSL